MVRLVERNAWRNARAVACGARRGPRRTRPRRDRLDLSWRNARRLFGIESQRTGRGAGNRVAGAAGPRLRRRVRHGAGEEPETRPAGVETRGDPQIGSRHEPRQEAPSSVNAAKSTAAYERWLAAFLDPIRADVRVKHASMRRDAFTFLRATFYLWAE